MSMELERGVQYTKLITMVTETCCKCGVPFGMPSDLRETLVKTHDNFYCPNGHTQHYSGETPEQKLRRELDRKNNELAQATTAKIQLESELNKANRKLKRVQKGVCPCCNRTFENLAKHMASKHPEKITTT